RVDGQATVSLPAEIAGHDEARHDQGGEPDARRDQVPGRVPADMYGLARGRPRTDTVGTVGAQPAGRHQTGAGERAPRRTPGRAGLADVGLVGHDGSSLRFGADRRLDLPAAYASNGGTRIRHASRNFSVKLSAPGLQAPASRISVEDPAGIGGF